VAVGGEPEAELGVSEQRAGMPAAVRRPTVAGCPESVGCPEPADPEVPRPGIYRDYQSHFFALLQPGPAGLIVLGQDYAYIAVRKKAEGFDVYQATATNAAGGAAEKESAPLPAEREDRYFAREGVGRSSLQLQLQHRRERVHGGGGRIPGGNQAGGSGQSGDLRRGGRAGA